MARRLVQDSDEERSSSERDLLSPTLEYASAITKTNPVAQSAFGNEHDTRLNDEQLSLGEHQTQNMFDPVVDVFSNSPAVLKLKRRQTTMEQIGNKKFEVYPRRTSLDDLELNSGSVRDQWTVRDQEARSIENAEKDLVDDQLIAVGANSSSDTTHNSTKHSKATETGQDLFQDITHTEARAVAPCGSPLYHTEDELAAPMSPLDSSGRHHSTNDHNDEATLSHMAEADSRGRDGKEKTSSQSKPKDVETRKDRKRRSDEQSQTDELCSDDRDAVIPVEIYKPRPSRFRAAGAADELLESIDFSKRPEAAIKKKSKMKRRKTTGGAVVVHVDDDDDLRDKMSATDEDRFQPARSSLSSGRPKKMKGDEQEDAWTEDIKSGSRQDILNQEDLERPKRRRGRPKKNTSQEREDGTWSKRGEKSLTRDSSGHEELSDSESDSDRPAARQKKKKRKERNGEKEPPKLKDAKDIELPTNGEKSESVAKKMSKKSKKSQISTAIDESSSGRHMSPLADKTSTINVSLVPPSVDSSKIQTQKENKQGNENTDDQRNLSAATSDKPGKASAPPKEQNQEAARPAAAVQSPLGKARTPYRVGLSKRARIEPLLRIVKK